MLDAPPSNKSVTQGEERPADTPRWVRCRACESVVARADERVAAPGASAGLHTFVNPAGEVFELCCFAAAPGALAHGPGSLEFTWFPGCAWRWAHCRQCGVQLGWQYTGAQVFWGLIRARLVW